MPASIQITSLENEWLLKLIKQQFELDITDSYSCQRLSSDLLHKNKVSISYNTLRRIFGIIAPKHQTSLYTLNALIKALGFENYSEFQKYIEKYKTDALNEVLIRYKATKKINETLLYESIKNFTLNSWEESYQLKLIIDLCIETNQYKLLRKIIQLPFNTEINDIHHKLYVSYQGIYLSALNNNRRLIEFIKLELSSSINLQHIILQTYIDEAHLKEFYGEWLTAVNKSQLQNFSIFRNALLCQKSYLEGNKKAANNYLMLAIKEIKNQKSVHPILRARISAWEIILNRKGKNYSYHFSQCKDEFEKINFNLFFYRLLFVFKKETTNIDLISKPHTTNILNKLSVFEKQIINKYDLILAVYFEQLGNREKSISHILKVDPRRFDVNEGQWYNEKYEELIHKIFKYGKPLGSN